MAFDAFLKIDGIDGESTDDKHKEWIEILSYSHGVSQPTSATLSSGGLRSAERSDHQDFSIVKTLDKASPKLNLFVSSGAHIPEITLELCREGEDRQCYMKYRLTGVIVSAVQPEGSTQSDKPLESVSFNYGKIEWIYTETDPETGTAKGDVRASWDVVSDTGS
jgi:type VI secretion system secreted protein Hcp